MGCLDVQAVNSVKRQAQYNTELHLNIIYMSFDEKPVK